MNKGEKLFEHACKGKLYLLLRLMNRVGKTAPSTLWLYSFNVKMVFVTAFLLIAGTGMAQKTIRLKQADKIVGRKEGNERFDWVVGNVIFTQNQTTIYCDSAKRNKKENSLQAFGNIRITDGDSITITALSLSYYGDKRMASLRKNVVFTKLKTATLYTDYLDFDRERNKAKYFNGGKLVDSTNTLTSKKGYYDTRSNMASFKTDVVGVNKDATMTSDTLQYHTKTKVVYFQDKTLVKDAEGKTATYTSGFFDTSTKQSNIKQGTMESTSYVMVGDQYELDDKKQFYRAKGHVVMTSKTENMTIYGDQGDYDKARGITKIFGRCFIAQVDAPGDTLFITADTLLSIDNKDPRKKRLLAYHRVKIFKNDMQGLADSLVYVQADSMLHFYRNPILWNGENQMTADTIRMQMRNKSIDKIYMVSNSFIASTDSLQNYNQIKSRLMTTHFASKQIHHVDVIGNGQSLYFVTEEKEVKDSVAILRITFLTGLNKIECSNMKINFAGGKLNNITFIKKPDATFIPPHEIQKTDTLLPGFLWRGREKPTRQQVVRQPIVQSTASAEPSSKPPQ
jgi:lipopolysaccharide export system protein LptA